jgi:hypothetical protein
MVKDTAKEGSIVATHGLRVALRTTLRMIRLVNGLWKNLPSWYMLFDDLIIRNWLSTPMAMPDLESHQETPPSSTPSPYTSAPDSPKRPTQTTHKWTMDPESMIFPFTEDYFNT